MPRRAKDRESVKDRGPDLQVAAEEAERVSRAQSGTEPRWGYRKGDARIFEVPLGGTLPTGWSDTPPKGEHPHERE